MKTIKIIKVDECYQFPHAWKDYEGMNCDRKEKIIPDALKIPSWCPLEDYQQIGDV